MHSVFSSAGASIKTIMIVDEEDDFLKQVKTVLEKEDVEVVTARNSREALEQLKEDNEETFDLILVNTRMPGSQLTNALFSMRPALKKLPGGIENFLQKPFTREELVEFVKEKINLR
jgi:response regulator RpfG family c-di-GMP phosphodiesterase